MVDSDQYEECKASRVGSLMAQGKEWAWIGAFVRGALNQMSRQMDAEELAYSQETLGGCLSDNTVEQFKYCVKADKAKVNRRFKEEHEAREVKNDS